MPDTDLLEQINLALNSEDPSRSKAFYEQLQHVIEQHHEKLTGEQSSITREAALEGQDFILHDSAWLRANDGDDNLLDFHFSFSPEGILLNVFQNKDLDNEVESLYVAFEAPEDSPSM